MILSFSQLNTYLSCPRSYYLKYLLKLKAPITSPWLVFGSKIHNMLSNNIFESEDPVEYQMLQRGKKFLESMPDNPIHETSYNDAANPCRFYGDIFGNRTVGIFDVFWEPEVCRGADFKTGSMYKTYVDHFEMQAYILNQLFKQKYDSNLKAFYFKFLKDDSIYQPKCLNDEKVSKKIEKSIKNILFNIEEGNYPKKCGKLCEKCDMNCFCSDESL